MPTIVVQLVYSGQPKDILGYAHQAKALYQVQSRSTSVVISHSVTKPLELTIPDRPDQPTLPSGDFWVSLMSEDGRALRNRLADFAELDHKLTGQVLGAIFRACDDAGWGWGPEVFQQVALRSGEIKLSSLVKLLNSEVALEALRASKRIHFGPRLEITAKELGLALLHHFD